MVDEVQDFGGFLPALRHHRPSSSLLHGGSEECSLHTPKRVGGGLRHRALEVGWLRRHWRDDLKRSVVRAREVGGHVGMATLGGFLWLDEPLPALYGMLTVFCGVWCSWNTRWQHRLLKASLIPRVSVTHAYKPAKHGYFKHNIHHPDLDWNIAILWTSSILLWHELFYNP